MAHGSQKSLQFKLERFLPIPAYQLGNDFRVTVRPDDAPADSRGLLEKIDDEKTFRLIEAQFPDLCLRHPAGAEDRHTAGIEQNPGVSHVGRR